ncbi:MAG TPA: antibiotic biosynthesis monooxygenase family protein [Ktedonobacterales bacterium]|jgi:quinol monooxygenase YgiN|nr:antibiotic biosynthesis monooxygenase family protein [Ktedonobacterales bacterium]
MVLEIAQFTARPGKAGELRDGLLRGLGVIRGASGCRSATLRHCVEEPDRFIYEIEWETLNDHIVTFRGGPLFAEYRAQINGLYTEPVIVHHYERVEG